MEKIQYQIEIAAPAKILWDTMLNKETYKQWVAKSWPDSFYEGNWKQGEKIRFIGADGSGTLAQLIEVKPYEKIYARHIAVLLPGGVEDTTSDVAKGWVGIIEEYRFAEHNGKTTLTVLIETNPAWRAMFEEGWPTALQELKRITERELTAA